MLPLLYNRFVAAGGTFKQQRIECLTHLADEFDVIINCSGLGAFELIGDTQILPIRGQVMRVRAPWLREIIMDDSLDGNYIIPKYA